VGVFPLNNLPLKKTLCSSRFSSIPLWEQRVVSSNLTAPTIENAAQIELFASSEKLADDVFEGGAKYPRCHSVDC
jgi:hypothetical protein